MTGDWDHGQTNNSTVTKNIMVFLTSTAVSPMQRAVAEKFHLAHLIPHPAALVCIITKMMIFQNYKIFCFDVWFKLLITLILWRLDYISSSHLWQHAPTEKDPCIFLIQRLFGTESDILGWVADSRLWMIPLGSMPKNKMAANWIWHFCQFGN